MGNKSFKALIFLCLQVGVIQAAFSQVTISGTVRDNRNQAIPGASIVLKDTYDGTVTDDKGYYTFETEEQGEQVLKVTSIGYDSTTLPIRLMTKSIVQNFILKESLNELTAVVITAGAFEASDSRRAAVVLSSLDIVTVAGSNGDVSGALKTLPGAQQVGEKEGLFVRGGDGFETKQFIDGTVVNNPYYSSVKGIASRGRFSPFIFKGTVFSTGGYSALYGGALSSVVILETTDMPDQSVISLSLSPIFAGMGTQQVNKKRTFSYGVGYNYINIGLYNALVKQNVEYNNIPQFHDGDANFRWALSDKSLLKYYGTISNGRFGLRRPDIDSVNTKESIELNNFSQYHNLSLRHYFAEKWRLDVGLGYSQNTDNLDHGLLNQENQPVETPNPYLYSKQFNLENKQQAIQGKVVLETKLAGLSALRGGVENQWVNYRSEFNSFPSSPQDVRDNLTALFAESDIYITNNLAAKIGVRAEHSTLLNENNIAPRISVAYKLIDNSQFSAAYGIFYQKPQDDVLLSGSKLQFMRADHYILNYLKNINQRIFRIEAFYKKYDHLTTYSPQLPFGVNYSNQGSGEAKGIELFWRDRKSIKNLDYWVSYSYLDTKRQYNGFPEAVRPDFATDHTASVVVKKFYLKWKTGINLTYNFATGRSYYFVTPDREFRTYVIADRGVTKPYQSMGVSINYVPNAGKPNSKVFYVIVASVNNIFGYQPEYGYNYSYDGQRKELVTSRELRGFFLGAFFSWGVDRTDDAINNNL